jgi:hypothetical protein
LDWDNYKNDTSITTPGYYHFNNDTIMIWKPYAESGYRIKIYCDRIPIQGELAGYDNNPVIPFDRYVKYGLVAKMIMSNKALNEKLSSQYYLMEFEKYKKAKTGGTTTQTHYQKPRGF